MESEIDKKAPNARTEYIAERMTNRAIFREIRNCGGMFNVEPLCGMCDIKCAYYREWIKRGKPGVKKDA